MNPPFQPRGGAFYHPNMPLPINLIPGQFPMPPMGK